MAEPSVINGFMALARSVERPYTLTGEAPVAVANAEYGVFCRLCEKINGHVYMLAVTPPVAVKAEGATPPKANIEALEKAYLDAKIAPGKAQAEELVKRFVTNCRAVISQDLGNAIQK